MGLRMSLTDWSAIAQIVVSVFTVVGVIASLYFSRHALLEVQADRRQRQKPHLAFERGGYYYNIKFVKGGKYVPGINPMSAQELLKHIPDGAESVRLVEKEHDDGSFESIDIGRLKNYGQGPALTTLVTWVPKEIWIGNENFKLDGEKLLEPVYSPELNIMPSVPSHILPNEEARLPRLPTFIDKDVDKKISRVDGVLIIHAQDVFGVKHMFMQEFRIFTYYKDEKPHLVVTFGETIRESNHDV